MARIPFDIKYRPQIESGEYKVVTGDDRPVKIICWDKKVFGGRFEIVGLVPTPQGDTETVQLYCPDGTLIASSWNEKYKLFIITPEPKMTEFEKAVKDLCWRVGMGEVVYEDDIIKKTAAELLDLAREQIVEEQYTSDPRKTDLYELGKTEVFKKISYAFKRGFEYGKKKALKDLPRWRHGYTRCSEGKGKPVNPEYACLDDKFLIILPENSVDAKCILLDDLKKLPGFKED